MPPKEEKEKTFFIGVFQSDSLSLLHPYIANADHLLQWTSSYLLHDASETFSTKEGCMDENRVEVFMIMIHPLIFVFAGDDIALVT